ncbi:MAG: SLATT domain-containing protein [Gaiellaceae bacterium]
MNHPGTPSETETKAQEWEEWTEAARLTHYGRADHFMTWNIWIGVLAIIATTVVSAGILVSIHSTPTYWGKVAAAILALVAAALAALKTYLNLGSLSEQHRTAAVGFGKVRRQVETFRLRHPPDDAQARAELDQLALEIGDLEMAGPGYPARIFSRKLAEVRAREDDIKVASD